MKIKLSVERGYNIDYYAVYDEISRLVFCCKRMETKAESLKISVPSSHQDILSVNYNKTRAISERIIKKLNDAEEELDELLKSCKQFAEKIQSTIDDVVFPI